MVKLLNQGFQPAAHGPHAASEAKLCGPRSHIHFNSISGTNEIMKPECTVQRSLAQLFTVVAILMGLIVKFLWKIYKTALILLHAACLKT